RDAAADRGEAVPPGDLERLEAAVGEPVAELAVDVDPPAERLPRGAHPAGVIHPAAERLESNSAVDRRRIAESERPPVPGLPRAVPPPADHPAAPGARPGMVPPRRSRGIEQIALDPGG